MDDAAWDATSAGRPATTLAEGDAALAEAPHAGTGWAN